MDKTSNVVEVMARAIDRSNKITTESGDDGANYPEDAAHAALEAIRSAGYVVVPVEPTEAMEDAAGLLDEKVDGPFPTGAPAATEYYRAMIAAAEGVE